MFGLCSLPTLRCKSSSQLFVYFVFLGSDLLQCALYIICAVFFMYKQMEKLQDCGKSLEEALWTISWFFSKCPSNSLISEPWVSYRHYEVIYSFKHILLFPALEKFLDGLVCLWSLPANLIIFCHTKELNLMQSFNIYPCNLDPSMIE